MSQIEQLDRILDQKNYWLDKMRETITKIGVASFEQDSDSVDELMFDLQTYRIIIEKFDIQMNFALTS